MLKKKDVVMIDGYNMLKTHIIESIKLLASSPETQLSLLPDFVNKPYEMATSLSDWLLLYNNGLMCKKEPLFSDFEIESITKLNSMFTGFEDSKSFEKSDWTEEAVRTSEKWEEVRKFAKHILSILGIEYSLPDKRSV